MPALVGPMPLAEALAACEPSPSGTRAAVSSPEGRFVAVQYADGTVEVRRVARATGHAGSVVPSGEWLEADGLPGRFSWRPA